MIGIGVVGYGYWGPNLVRNFMESEGAIVKVVADTNPARLDVARKRYPGVALTADFGALVNDPAVDAVVIATPVASHYDLARQALEAGKHVLVEKPLVSTSEQADRLIDLASQRDLVLLVDHTFVYTAAVRRIRKMVDEGDLGSLYYYDSTRINLGIFQHDVDVLWDLAVHDLSILDYVLPVRPCAVSATGISHVSDLPLNTAYMTLFFNESLIAHIHASWLAPVKLRRTLIGGSRKMIVYDELESSEKIKVYDKGISVSENSEEIYRTMVGYRTGDMFAPVLENVEALQVEVRHFVQCIEKKETPLTGGESGRRVVRILEAAARSLDLRGAPVELV
jgi:predicted dehydrogenase